MRVKFAQSRQSTLGIEWELAVIDARTMEQVPEAHVLLDGLSDPVNGPIRREYFTSMIELVTGVHDTVPSAVAELRSLLDQALSVLEPRGLTLLGAGTHPFGVLDDLARAALAARQHRRQTLDRQAARAQQVLTYR